MLFTIHKIESKSILTKCNINGIDYALNPYIGCLHGCRYCYADFMRRFTGHREPWGKFLDVKINAPLLLEKELMKKKSGVVAIGTVTDAYQPVELQYKLTRKCLIKLLDSTMSISILTKSANILRDKDILVKFKNIEVGFTVTLLDEGIKKLFEPLSSSSKERLRACGELSALGITTWIFFGPVLPYFGDSESHIRALLTYAKKSGAKYVLVDVLNPYPSVWARIISLIQKNFSPRILDKYLYYYEHKFLYRKELKHKILKINAKVQIPVRFAF